MNASFFVIMGFARQDRSHGERGSFAAIKKHIIISEDEKDKEYER